MTKSWNHLPAETVQLITSFLVELGYEETVHQCASVCRGWKTAAIRQAYKGVSLDTVSRLLKFNRTIVENADIANIVKKVELCITIDVEDPEQSAHFYTLLINLPSLQYFYSSRTPCYVLITEALIDSKLKNLVGMGDGHSLEFSYDYVNCILHLKNRLQNVLLSMEEGELSRRLYNRLDQFKELKNIYIHKVPINPIEGLDAIVEKCPGLRQVEIEFDEDCFDEPLATVRENDIPLLYTPRLAIRTLGILGEVDEVHQSILTYIMHKYPNLDNFNCYCYTIEMTDLSTLKRLIAYISKIKSVSVANLAINVDWISEAIGSFWEARRLLYPNTLANFHINRESLRTHTYLKLGSKLNDLSTALEDQFSDYNFRDTDLFARYGGHVGILKILGFTKRSMMQGNLTEGVQFMEDLIASCLMYCGQLHQLSLYDCYIQQMNRSIVCKSAQLQVLCLRLCSISNHVFETAFSSINYIDALTLEDCKYLDEENKVTPFTKINMPNTTIKSVLFKYDDISNPGSSCIFVSISLPAKETPERVKNYYKFDYFTHDGDYLIPSSELEYNAEKYSDVKHLHISCRSITALEVIYNRHAVRLPPQ